MHIVLNVTYTLRPGAQEAFLATDFACWIGVPEETAGEND